MRCYPPVSRPGTRIANEGMIRVVVQNTFDSDCATIDQSSFDPGWEGEMSPKGVGCVNLSAHQLNS